MSLLLPDTGLLFWMVIIFALVFFILAKFGFPVITKMIEKRNDHIEKALEDAHQAEIKLSKLEDEQKALIQKTQVEQERLVKESLLLRERIISDARDEAQSRAARILDDARREIAVEKDRALNEARSQVALLSVEVAEKIVRKNLESDSEQTSLAERLFEELSSPDKERK